MAATRPVVSRSVGSTPAGSGTGGPGRLSVTSAPEPSASARPSARRAPVVAPDPLPAPMPGLAMVASDLDGTLLDGDGELAPRTAAALDAARARGVEVVAVTGRPPRWLAPLATALGGGLAVCANGGLVWDLGLSRAVAVHPFDPADVAEIAAVLARELPGAAVALETLAGFRRTPGYVLRPGAVEVVEPAGIDELLAQDPQVVKVLVRRPGATCDALLAAVRGCVAHLGEPTHSGAAAGLVEISARGVSKAGTLAGLAASRRITAGGVVAFGDMPNDLPMLAWAGTSWAMANAHPEVLAAADHVAPAHTEDGVARVVEALLG